MLKKKDQDGNNSNSVEDDLNNIFLYKLDLEHTVLNQLVEKDSNECLLVLNWIKYLKKVKNKLLANTMMVVDKKPIKQFSINIMVSLSKNLINNDKQPKTADI